MACACLESPARASGYGNRRQIRSFARESEACCGSSTRLPKIANLRFEQGSESRYTGGTVLEIVFFGNL